MTGKEYFLRVLDAEKRIVALRKQREHLEDLAYQSPGLSASGIRSKSGDHSPLERAVVRLIDKESQLACQINTYLDLVEEAERVVKKIKDERYRQLLSMRYFSRRPWEKIAEETGYSLRQVFRLHGRALLEAEIIIGIRKRGAKE